MDIEYTFSADAVGSFVAALESVRIFNRVVGTEYKTVHEVAKHLKNYPEARKRLSLHRAVIRQLNGSMPDPAPLQLRGVLDEVARFEASVDSIGDPENALPAWCLPQTIEDRAAIYTLVNRCDINTLEELVESYYHSCRTRNLFLAFAVFMYETLASANSGDPKVSRVAKMAQDLGEALKARVVTGNGSDPLPRDVPREISHLAARLMVLFDFRSDEAALYRELAATHLWMMDQIWVRSCMDSRQPPFVKRPEVIQFVTSTRPSHAALEKWFYTSFTLALMYYALNRLHSLPLKGPEGRFLCDWLLGRTDDPDGFIAEHMLNASISTREEDRRYMREIAEDLAGMAPSRWTLSATTERAINRKLRVRMNARGTEESSDSGTHPLRLSLFKTDRWRGAERPFAKIREGIASDSLETQQGDGDTPKMLRKRVLSKQPLTDIKDSEGDDWTPADESALLMPEDSPTTKGSFALVDLTKDVALACKQVGLTTAQTRLYIAKGFWPRRRQMQAEYAGIPEESLEAAEKKIYRVKAKIAELLAAYQSQWQRGPETEVLHRWRSQHWPWSLMREYRQAPNAAKTPLSGQD